MTPTLSTPPASCAQSTARANFRANCDALHLTLKSPNLTYLLARDGSLTARTSAGWLANCSLPYRAAISMMQSVEAPSTTSCLLAPNHPALIRRTLEILTPEQALIVLSPDPDFLPIAFHCHDFSQPLRSGRLFFATGDSWPSALTQILTDNPGLPPPTVFLRPPTTDPSVSQSLIDTAQPLFKSAHATRASLLTSTVQSSTRGDRLCIVSPSSFRLWSDAGSVLADLFPASDITRLDPDLPTTASHLALAQAAAHSRALLTADFSRSDCPEVLHPDTPWLTFVTTPKIPSANSARPHDRLILADPQWHPAAIQLGWTSAQLTTASWPTEPLTPANTTIGLFADTTPLPPTPDESTFELSSHLVLFELITHELTTNPLLALTSPESYLTSRLTQLGISDEAFDRHFFLHSLIHPLLQQGIARLLLSHNLPLKLFGKSWHLLPEFSPHSQGPILSRPHLRQLASTCSLLLTATPPNIAHPADSFPHHLRPTAQSFLQQITTPKKVARVSNPCSPLSPQLIQSLI